MSRYTQTKKSQDLVDAWNKRYGIGEPVLVKKDLGEIIQTTTRSKAQVLPSGQAVIWLVGISGCYALERVAPINSHPVRADGVRPEHGVRPIDPALGTGSYLDTLANPPYQESQS